MQIPTSLSLILFQFLAGSSLATADCGPGKPCPLTATCSTITRTTTTAVCAPTPTCLRVYQDCNFETGEVNCCSGYCAATKCRPTDPRWPDCTEDMGACETDDECCYNDNKCVDGFCRKQES